MSSGRRKCHGGRQRGVCPSVGTRPFQTALSPVLLPHRVTPRESTLSTGSPSSSLVTHAPSHTSKERSEVNKRETSPVWTRARDRVDRKSLAPRVGSPGLRTEPCRDEWKDGGNRETTLPDLRRRGSAHGRVESETGRVPDTVYVRQSFVNCFTNSFIL